MLKIKYFCLIVFTVSVFLLFSSRAYAGCCTTTDTGNCGDKFCTVGWCTNCGFALCTILECQWYERLYVDYVGTCEGDYITCPTTGVYPYCVCEESCGPECCSDSECGECGYCGGEKVCHGDRTKCSSAQDTDGGIDVFHKGTCTDYTCADGYSGGYKCVVRSSGTDYCQDSRWVVEYAPSGMDCVAYITYSWEDCDSYDTAWADTGNTRTDPNNFCVIQKEQSRKNYKCSAGACVYDTLTQWVFKENKPLSTSCGSGPWEQDPDNACKERRALNHCDGEGSCVFDTYEYRDAITSCINNDNCCPSGCNANNDNDCAAQCGNDVVEPGEGCELPNTNPPSNPASTCNPDGWYCSDSVREQRDYKCGSTCLCTYDVTSSEDCAAKASTDSDGGDIPGTAGYCRDYITCSAGACTYTDYDDSCVSSTHLTEYYASGASCTIHDYYCSDFEVLASGDTADDPTTTGTCFGGYAAGCSANAFWRTAQPSITEGCVNSADCFSNGGPGDANCLFLEAYAIDSVDPCPGNDACTSKTYDPDTNSNTCNSCVGPNRWSIGGDISNCCGDDANEYRKTRICEPGSCSSNPADDACCNSNTKCVWNSVCYSSGSTHPTNDCWYCDSGTWRNRLCGYACTNGICDGSGNCYTGAGSQTACSGVLDCSVPTPPPAYTRDLTGSCNRPSGTHKRSGTGVCDLTSCVLIPSYTDPIQGGWTSIEYPSSTYTYKIGDTIQVKVKGITATAGFTPLLECRLNKTDKNGNPAGGTEFDAWVSGPFPKDVTFSYTVKSTDPSGYWSIDYCVLVTDFFKNYGWTLQSDWAKHICCVSTELVAG